MEKEIWRSILGYEGLYEVSDIGRIKSLGNNARRKEKILKQRAMPSGWMRVGLCKEGVEHKCSVQKLVDCAFRGCPSPIGAVLVFGC